MAATFKSSTAYGYQRYQSADKKKKKYVHLTYLAEDGAHRGNSFISLCNKTTDK